MAGKLCPVMRDGSKCFSGCAWSALTEDSGDVTCGLIFELYRIRRVLKAIGEKR